MTECMRNICYNAPGFSVRQQTCRDGISMSLDRPQPLRVAMLARVVFPLHGFGGIERHVFHLVTHLARLGVRVTLYVQPSLDEDERRTTNDESLAIHAGVRSSSVLRPS